MFDIGWSEMAIIAVVTLVVLGPKELPHALKMFSHWMRAARKLGSEFQSGVNEIVREAELDDAKRELQALSRQSIGQKIEKAIDPSGDLKKAINAPVEETKAALSSPPADAASPVTASGTDTPAVEAAATPVAALPAAEVEEAVAAPPIPAAPASTTPSPEAEPPAAANADSLSADDHKSDKSVSA